nr:hypothetical protein [uncultured Prevotella sp.]
MKKTINVNKEHLNGIIKELDDKHYFYLGKRDTDRKDLFNFALALGLQKGVPTPLSASDGFVRSEYIESIMYMYQGVFYDKVLSEKPDDIDKIADKDAVISLVEEYANTGFYCLAELKKDFPDEEHFMSKLLNEMDRIQEEYLDVYEMKTIVTGEQ